MERFQATKAIEEYYKSNNSIDASVLFMDTKERPPQKY